MKLIHLALLSSLITICLFILPDLIKTKNTNVKSTNIDLTKPVKKVLLDQKIYEIIEDSFKHNTKLFVKSSDFYIKNVMYIQDTLKQKIVVNFRLYKPLKDNSDAIVMFVMITFLRKEIDIVEWSYLQDFVKDCENLFETENCETSFIKQK